MHQLIRIITTAHSNEDAAYNARVLFEGHNAPLIGPFDYGTLMNEGGRWSDVLPEVVQETGAIEANTDEGMAEIEEAWEHQNKALKRYYDVIKAGFERGMDFDDVLADTTIEDVDVEPWNVFGLAQDEDDLADTYTSSVRYAMYNLGKYHGSDIYLYTDAGESIREPTRYSDYIDAIKADDGYYEELDDTMTWYVVPVDVHY